MRTPRAPFVGVLVALALTVSIASAQVGGGGKQDVNLGATETVETFDAPEAGAANLANHGNLEILKNDKPKFKGTAALAATETESVALDEFDIEAEPGSAELEGELALETELQHRNQKSPQRPALDSDTLEEPGEAEEARVEDANDIATGDNGENVDYGSTTAVDEEEEEEPIGNQKTLTASGPALVEEEDTEEDDMLDEPLEADAPGKQPKEAPQTDDVDAALEQSAKASLRAGEKELGLTSSDMETSSSQQQVVAETTENHDRRLQNEFPVHGDNTDKYLNDILETIGSSVSSSADDSSSSLSLKDLEEQLERESEKLMPSDPRTAADNGLPSPPIQTVFDKSSSGKKGTMKPSRPLSKPVIPKVKGQRERAQIAIAMADGDNDRIDFLGDDDEPVPKSAAKMPSATPDAAKLLADQADSADTPPKPLVNNAKGMIDPVPKIGLLDSSSTPASKNAQPTGADKVSPTEPTENRPKSKKTKTNSRKGIGGAKASNQKPHPLKAKSSSVRKTSKPKVTDPPKSKRSKPKPQVKGANSKPKAMSKPLGNSVRKTKNKPLASKAGVKAAVKPKPKKKDKSLQQNKAVVTPSTIPKATPPKTTTNNLASSPRPADHLPPNTEAPVVKPNGGTKIEAKSSSSRSTIAPTINIAEDTKLPSDTKVPSLSQKPDARSQMLPNKQIISGSDLVTKLQSRATDSVKAFIPNPQPSDKQLLQKLVQQSFKDDKNKVKPTGVGNDPLKRSPIDHTGPLSTTHPTGSQQQPAPKAPTIPALFDDASAAQPSLTPTPKKSAPAAPSPPRVPQLFPDLPTPPTRREKSLPALSLPPAVDPALQTATEAEIKEHYGAPSSDPAKMRRAVLNLLYATAFFALCIAVYKKYLAKSLSVPVASGGGPSMEHELAVLRHRKERMRDRYKDN